mmetsp:Transcript_47869/g.112551  ORF Transcript_47869/g.112551 Transcript_47869/m.112551 type:complete len:214 (-) Transcript_47869:21-662(-)
MRTRAPFSWSKEPTRKRLMLMVSLPTRLPPAALMNSSLGDRTTRGVSAVDAAASATSSDAHPSGCSAQPRRMPQQGAGDPVAFLASQLSPGAKPSQEPSTVCLGACSASEATTTRRVRDWRLLDKECLESSKNKTLRTRLCRETRRHWNPKRNIAVGVRLHRQRLEEGVKDMRRVGKGERDCRRVRGQGTSRLLLRPVDALDAGARWCRVFVE